MRDEVEAVTDVETWPTVAANGNRTLFTKRSNRHKLGFALFNDACRNERFGQGCGCRQRLPDKSRLHGGVERLAGRHYSGGGRMTFAARFVPGVTGLAREDFIFDHTDNPASGTLSYRPPSRSSPYQDQCA